MQNIRTCFIFMSAQSKNVPNIVESTQNWSILSPNESTNVQLTPAVRKSLLNSAVS